jgi:hypothetical protein
MSDYLTAQELADLVGCNPNQGRRHGALAFG